CSLAVLEAWASGLPVITSRMNGAAELMAAGREGLIVEDPANVAEVASAMQSLLEAETRAAMERPARALAEANSLGTSFGRIVEIYESILERRRREMAA
ncbi:MAG: glycosyltransferase, partial [Candidatus Binatia bacterium]